MAVIEGRQGEQFEADEDDDEAADDEAVGVDEEEAD